MENIKKTDDGSLIISNLDVYYTDKLAVNKASLSIPKNKVTAFIGPSGCGKSTLLKAINRMNEEVEGCRTSGKIIWKGINILDSKVDPVALRSKIGMVFQKPNPFPRSIYDNVAYGPRIHGIKIRRTLMQLLKKFESCGLMGRSV